MKTKLQLVTVLALAATAAIYAQGPLAPPGAPAPTMKTLDQIEPRTALATVTGDADYHHVIAQPGSYYLTGNLVASKVNGIHVTAAGVTLDLNGFSIRSASLTPGDAITIGSQGHRCTVKNGTIGAGAGGLGFGFAYGVHCAPSPSSPRGGTLLQLAVSGCTTVALLARQGWEITGCEVHDNVGGIDGLAGGLTITGCTASYNTGSGGAITAHSSTIRDCTAYGNNGGGIFGGIGSTITGCTAQFNEGDGIAATDSSTITGCTAARNNGDGIQVRGSCFVQGNTCSLNGFFAGDGAGIHATEADNRIEGNLVHQNNRGIDVDLAGSLIIKNSATENSTNYVIAANNKVGVIVSAPNSPAISGSTGGAGVGSTDPWANFSY